MGKKTAEEILYKNFFNVVGEPANDNEWQEIKQHPMHKATVTAMEQYSSLQSEEKDKEIKLVQSIMAQQLIEIERLREALSDVKRFIPSLRHLAQDEFQYPDNCIAALDKIEQALSNQPIESDKDIDGAAEVIKIEWRGDQYRVSKPDWDGDSVVTLKDHHRVIDDKDRRIKELQHLLNEALDFTTSDDELNGRIRKALNP